MSVLRPRFPRLAFVAMSLILMGALVAAPSVSGARNAVKQFIVSIDPTGATGGVAGNWTMTITNCGGLDLEPPCTLSSTIGLGAIRVTVPIEFRPVSLTSVSSPNWTAIYDPATGNISATANGGSFKLQPGGSLSFTFSATPESCAVGTKTFTTAAWGSTVVSGTDPFAIQGGQPTVNVAANGGCVTSGGTVIGPNGQTETITGNFQGHVSVTFGGNLDCSFDPIFGGQWSDFHLPTQVNITPAADFVGNGPKISTSKFPAGEADSSSYLICYAVPTANHDSFITRGGSLATERTVDGAQLFVGILPNCYNPATGGTRPEPCVSEQFLELATNKIVISVRMQPGDPFKK